MKDEIIAINEKSTGRVSFAKVLVSLRQTSGLDCEVLVGYPGLPSVIKRLRTGDAVLFESPNDGVLEVRVMSVASLSAEFLVTQVSPRPGLAAALTNDSPHNAAFTPEERAQIKESLSAISTAIETRTDVAPEQIDLIRRKLDEIHEASGRLGRKDWINYVAGSLTSLCISASFSPEVTKALFHAANGAFSWLFRSALAMLS